MKTNELSKLRAEMEKVQDGKRYEHTLGVAYTAANLAACHGGDIEKALIAGMLHDCAKPMTDHKLLALCEKHHLPISSQERKKPSLLHARAGSYLAHKKYGVADPEVLDAICYHTTGRPGMSLLEKIIFVADYIEPGRRQAPRLEQLRRMAYADLDQAVLAILEDTLVYLRENAAVIDQTTQETYNYYVNARQSGQEGTLV